MEAFSLFSSILSGEFEEGDAVKLAGGPPPPPPLEVDAERLLEPPEREAV